MSHQDNAGPTTRGRGSSPLQGDLCPHCGQAMPVDTLPLPIVAVSRETVPDFNLFWSIWPKKVARADAVKVWEKTFKGKNAPDLDDLLVGVQRVKAMVDQNLVEKQYLPNPDRWLRGRRWEDHAADVGQPTKSFSPPPMPHVPHFDRHPAALLTEEERAKALRRWPDPTGWDEISREHAIIILNERPGGFA